MMPPVAILAGGRATRLYPVTKKIPKSLIEIAGKPFIFHQLALMKREGVSRVVLCLGYRGEQVRHAVGDGSEFGIDVEYSFDGEQLRGTGGALRKALPLLGEMFMVIYGDAYLDTCYRPVVEAFASQKKSGLMTVYENRGKWDTSNIIFRDGEIITYDKDKRTSAMNHIDYGLSLFRDTAVSPYPENVPFDLAAVHRDLLSAGELMGYEVHDRFYEIGSPEGRKEFDEHVSRHGSALTLIKEHK